MNRIREFSATSYVVTVGVFHNLNLAARYADQIVLLNDGRIVSNRTPDAVLTADRIRDVFAVETTFATVENAGVHLIFD